MWEYLKERTMNQLRAKLKRLNNLDRTHNFSKITNIIRRITYIFLRLEFF